VVHWLSNNKKWSFKVASSDGTTKKCISMSSDITKLSSGYIKTVQYEYLILRRWDCTLYWHLYVKLVWSDLVQTINWTITLYQIYKSIIWMDQIFILDSFDIATGQFCYVTGHWYTFFCSSVQMGNQNP
jgi:hypothetical protein